MLIFQFGSVVLIYLPNCPGDEFKELAESYLVAGLKKGIPSLFADIKSLYDDPQKLEVIESIVETHRGELAAPTPTPESAEPPTTYLWTLYFLAQHYSHIGQHTRSLGLLEEALNHTPTLPELHMLQARVLKRLGDPFGAARCMDEARVLDLQDRFLNTKCGKYRLRAGMQEEAQEVLGLFTKVCTISLPVSAAEWITVFYDTPRKMLRVPVLTWRTCNRYSSFSKMLIVTAEAEISRWP